jgi:hypothetical protein
MNFFVVYASEKPFEPSNSINIPFACPLQGNAKYVASEMRHVFKLCISCYEDLDEYQKSLLKHRINNIAISSMTDKDREKALIQLNNIKLKIINQKKRKVKVSEKRTTEQIY